MNNREMERGPTLSVLMVEEHFGERMRQKEFCKLCIPCGSYVVQERVLGEIWLVEEVGREGR